MSDLKLLHFPTNPEHRLQAHIKRLYDYLWAADSGEYINEILQVIEDYLMQCPDDVARDLALVNLQSTIICLDYYFNS